MPKEKTDIRQEKQKGLTDKELIEKIKSIENRRYIGDGKYWTCPLSMENLLFLQGLGFWFDAVLNDFIVQNQIKEETKQDITGIPGLKKTLFPFQVEGVNFTEKQNGRVLIGDEMGLGKTIQAILWLMLRNELRPVIIVCPAFLKYVWNNELISAGITDIQILSGQKANLELTSKFILVNYDILKYWETRLIAFDAKLIIIDEAHYIASDSAQRSQACKKIAKKIPHRLGLTGTPFETRVAQIYNIVNIINPALFPVKISFLYQYCGPKNNGFAMTFDGATNVAKLNKILRENILIRRLKKDVLKDLPDKTFEFIPIELTNRTKYEKALENFKKYLRNKLYIEVKREITKLNTVLAEINHKALKEEQKKEVKKANALYLMSELKQILIKGKIHGIIEWINNFLDSDEKLVIFCEHTWTIDYLMEKYAKIAVKIDGSVSPKKKYETVEQFQTNKKIKLIICNAAGQEGLTMTAASNLAHIEFPQTPGKLAQRTDRIHRIGQKYPVTIHYLVALNTIEEIGIRKLDEKARTFSQVLDGKDIESFDLISYLIDEIYAEKD